MMKRLQQRLLQTGLLTAIGLVSPAFAFAIDKIYSPLVEQGELEVETRGSYADDNKEEKDGEYVQKFALGYGLTDRYAAEILGEIEKEKHEDTRFEALEFENRFQLTDHNEYWLDAGLYLAMEWKPDDGDYELESRVLLEKTTGKFVHTSNIIFSREIFQDGHIPIDGGISWGTRYRWMPEVQPGFEVHLDVGQLNDVEPIKDQQYSAGPALRGYFSGFKYLAAPLIGITDDAPDLTVRFELEYGWDI